MTRVRIDLNISLDGYSANDQTPEKPMGEDWARLTAAYVGTRTFRQRVFGDTTRQRHDRRRRLVRRGVLRGDRLRDHGRGHVRPARLPRRPGLEGLVG